MMEEVILGTLALLLGQLFWVQYKLGKIEERLKRLERMNAEVEQLREAIFILTTEIELLKKGRE